MDLKEVIEDFATFLSQYRVLLAVVLANLAALLAILFVVNRRYRDRDYQTVATIRTLWRKVPVILAQDKAVAIAARRRLEGGWVKWKLYLVYRFHALVARKRNWVGRTKLADDLDDLMDSEDTIAGFLYCRWFGIGDCCGVAGVYERKKGMPAKYYFGIPPGFWAAPIFRALCLDHELGHLAQDQADQCLIRDYWDPDQDQAAKTSNRESQKAIPWFTRIFYYEMTASGVNIIEAGLFLALTPWLRPGMAHYVLHVSVSHPPLLLLLLIMVVWWAVVVAVFLYRTPLQSFSPWEDPQ